MNTEDKAIKVFCGYAQEDKSLFIELKKHLAALVNTGLITLWANVDISAGAKWQEEINKHLDETDIILFLFSADFMASKRCSREVELAMQRQQRGKEVHVIVVCRIKRLMATFGESVRLL